MARPIKIASELRDEIIQARVTLAEKVAFEQKAAEAEMTPSDFLRALIKAKRIQQPKLSVFDREASAAMIRMGSNLNQIARHMNSGGNIDARTSQMIEEIHTEMHDLYGRMVDHMARLGMFDGL